jgi:hypothetical protein
MHKDRKSYQRVVWLTQNLHEILWTPGHLDYSQLQSIIKRLGAFFFEKGIEKCLLLSQLFDRDFINLESRGCPTIQELSPGRSVCDSYTHRHANSNHCAQRKAIIYSDWFTDFDDLFQICKLIQ